MLDFTILHYMTAHNLSAQKRAIVLQRTLRHYELMTGFGIKYTGTLITILILEYTAGHDLTMLMTMTEP